MMSDSAELQAEPREAPEPGELTLWLRWQGEGDESARQALMEMHLPFAKVFAATQYSLRTHAGVEFADYHQIASAALIESMQRFDPARGVLFRTFAAHRMRGAIRDGAEAMSEKARQVAVRSRLQRERAESLKESIEEAAEEKRLSRSQLEDALFAKLAEIGIGLALGVMLEGTGMILPDEETAQVPAVRYFRDTELRQLQAVVRKLVDRLPEREGLVIKYHYFQGEEFTDIAVKLKVTRGRIAQIHRKALFSLLALLREFPDMNVAI